MNNKIRRNELDIILTDLLPVEISEAFTMVPFYQYLNKNISKLNELEKKLTTTKYSNDVVFERGWFSTPLKYEVFKNVDTTRTLSVLNPFAMVQVYLFIKLYGDSILNRLEKNSLFSIRYHSPKSSLYYLRKRDGFVEYLDKEMIESMRIESIESTGMFFNIKDFSRIVKFFSSNQWFRLNTQYKYFAKLDYQSCFDSIYTHTFKWAVSKNVIDSRNYSKTNHVLSVIDRILQQINSSISNGIVVGPEFSRMIAEILLQHIDIEVYNNLLEHGIHHMQDYEVQRYVDDIYIFSNKVDIRDTIVEKYKKHSKKYQLRINETKTTKGSLPYVWNTWLHDAKLYSSQIESKHFYEYQMSIEHEHLIRTKNIINNLSVSSLKEEFQRLISIYPEHTEKIVAYVFGLYTNKIARIKVEDDDGNRLISLFRKNVSEREIFGLLDFIFFHYAYAPTFRNTQKLISFIYSVRLNLNDQNIQSILQELITKYSYVFSNAIVNDIVNILLLLKNYEIRLQTSFERELWEKITLTEDPILFATFLIYAEYDMSILGEVSAVINQKLQEKIDVITDKEHLLLYNELWWILAFNKCPHIISSVTDKMNEKISMLESESDTVNSCVKRLLLEFLNAESDENTFIKWDINSYDYVRSITFKTHERTLFNNDFSEDSIAWEY